MTVGDERMADEQTRFNASKFPKITKQAVDFYEKGASEDEKKIVADAIRRAAKTIKKSQRDGEEGEEADQKKKKGLFKRPTPEQVASGLYRVLAATASGKVSG